MTHVHLGMYGVTTSDAGRGQLRVVVYILALYHLPTFQLSLIRDLFPLLGVNEFAGVADHS